MVDYAYAEVPQRVIGPLELLYAGQRESIYVPLATFEKPLWPSVQRGARVTKASGGIQTVLIQDGMTRSVVVEANSLTRLKEVLDWLENQNTVMQEVVAATSSYCRLKSWHYQIVSRLLYIRFTFKTGEAAGHNMATKAAEALLTWLLSAHPDLHYVSISANICTDKKPQAINGILGRGKSVIAEVTIPRELCQSMLRTSPEKIVNLNLKKNWIGSCLAGSIRTANAHFANMLLAFYLATGQDAANIVEGSQGMTHTEVIDGDLYFSVNLPNIILGAYGNGKQLPFVKKNLELLRCDRITSDGESSQKLAMIGAAVVLCGELSLLAAQTNKEELMRSHIALERSIFMPEQ